MSDDEQDADLAERLTAFRALHRVVARLNGARNLSETLHAVADGVVSTVGFQLCIVNLVRDDGDLEVAAVSGPEDARRALLGQVGSRASWQALLDAGHEWGALRFMPADSVPDGEFGLPYWASPEIEQSSDPDAWQADDGLLAPLVNTTGELVGVLSVDLPVDGRRPNRWRRELLEMFAVQAAIAIDNARAREHARHTVAELERERDRRTLRASEDSYRRAFESAPSGMAMISMREQDSGRLLRVNDALCRMVGKSAVDLLSVGIEPMVHPEDRLGYLRVWRAVARQAATGQPRHTVGVPTAAPDAVATVPADVTLANGGAADIPVTDMPVTDRPEVDIPGVDAAPLPRPGEPDGQELRLLGSTPRWVSLRASAVRDHANRPHFLLVQLEDIDEQKRREADLARAALRDPLTGLSNVAGLRERLGLLLREGHAVGVLFGDLDGFKEVNDRYGHIVGDAVLVELGDRIRSVVRVEDLVARVGGDEFIVVGVDVTEVETAELADRLTMVTNQPINHGEIEVTQPVSFGYAHQPAQRVTPRGESARALRGPELAAWVDEHVRALISRADAAMYQRKRARATRPGVPPAGTVAHADGTPVDGRPAGDVRANDITR